MNPRRLLPIVVAAFALAAVPASAQAAPPPNDAFATAQPLTLDVPVQGTVVDATVESSEPAHAGDRRSKSVWYSYTSPTDGAVTLDACDATFDDVIATYTGTAFNSFTAGPSVDDACNDLGAKVSLQVKAGVTVWIAIAGVEGGAGTFTLVAHAETVPPNDAFVDAVTLKPGRVQGSNTLATRELGEPAVAEGGGGSVWYRYRTNTPPAGDARHVELQLRHRARRLHRRPRHAAQDRQRRRRRRRGHQPPVLHRRAAPHVLDPRRRLRVRAGQLRARAVRRQHRRLRRRRSPSRRAPISPPCSSAGCARRSAAGARATWSCRSACRRPRRAGSVCRAAPTGCSPGRPADCAATAATSQPSCASPARRAAHSSNDSSVTVVLRAELKGTRSSNRFVTRTIRLADAA